MPKLNFLGAHIRHVDLRSNSEGTIFVRIDMTCDLTRPLADKLGCADALDVDSVKVATLALEEIPLTELKLVKSGMPQELEILAHGLKDFRIVRTDDEGVISRELRFHITAPGDTIPLIHEYWSQIGSGRGKLTATTIKQEELAEVEQTEPEQQQLDGGAGKPNGKPKRKRRRDTADQPAVATVEDTGTEARA